MKEQVKLPAVIALAVVVLGALVFFGMKAMNAGNLDQGQVRYTPGKPPWDDPTQKANQPAVPPGGGPPGMTVPSVNNAPH